MLYVVCLFRFYYALSFGYELPTGPRSHSSVCKVVSTRTAHGVVQPGGFCLNKYSFYLVHKMCCVSVSNLSASVTLFISVIVHGPYLFDAHAVFYVQNEQSSIQ